ncbi:PIN domain-containing protein [Candidatus Venteria ishoeyi]|uniref:PIN-like domain-containing protein n=1 Tax=Candidatus Venteria ishoeyi TaxID=1899563 RepID=A0A1H6FI37_9GAMM|nr:PIN domain-containing protein [Candidatus Venteria ishoeyi]SEH09091.1 Uncharacterised protein [Candidatus Venteria ishoeyi]
MEELNNIKNIKILLIDLENCPNQILQLQKNLEEYTKVIICYAKTGVKIPLDWLVPLSTVVNDDKLKIFKMTNTGKNSADFGICFFAGSLMQEFKKNAHFVIISNDTDLDHVVNLLVSQGCTAERIGTKKDVVTLNNKLDLPAIQLYCTHLVNYSKNRPSKKDTLLNSIKNKLKDSPEVAEDILQSLIKRKALEIAEKKVTYNDKKINEIANLTNL